MLTTPHAAAGVALGAAIGNPLVVIPAAMASHFILDAVPHWQEILPPYIPTTKTYVRVPLDIALAVGITVLATHWQPQHTAAIWTGAVCANLPDLDSIIMVAPEVKRGILKRYWDWHCRIQRETDSLWGLVPQLAVVATSLAITYLA